MPSRLAVRSISIGMDARRRDTLTVLRYVFATHAHSPVVVIATCRPSKVPNVLAPATAATGNHHTEYLTLTAVDNDGPRRHWRRE
jgi:hypothetical protein